MYKLIKFFLLNFLNLFRKDIAKTNSKKEKVEYRNIYHERPDSIKRLLNWGERRRY